MNEIHGSWYDPSNPVVMMSGSLRDDLFADLLRIEHSADLCLCLGTSLSGMNADRVADMVSRKALYNSASASASAPAAPSPASASAPSPTTGDISTAASSRESTTGMSECVSVCVCSK
jgi:hypothetical protein